jgi:hypothetical protein
MLLGTIKRVSVFTAMILVVVLVAMRVFWTHHIVYSQGTYTLVISKAEPLPNCAPPAVGQSLPLIWDITISQLMGCTALNIWTQVGGGASGIFTLSPSTAGAHWTDKVVTAITALGGGGGAINIPDSVADDGSATTPSIPSNVSLNFVGSSANFKFCHIILGNASKIYSPYGATLSMNVGGSGCQGIEHTGFLSLQSTEKTILNGINVNCQNQPASTGIKFVNTSTKDWMENVSVTGCGDTTAGSAGFRFDDQFAHISNMSLQQNYVNMKMLGGNVASNSFYDLKVQSPGSGVNIFQSPQTVGSSAQNDNFFYNLQCQNGTVACFATVATANGCSTWTFIGGAPELNNGSSSAVIEGVTIPHSGEIYNSGCNVVLQDFSSSDATADPQMLTVNNGQTVMTNFGGGGGQFNINQADSTSHYVVNGTLAMNGIIQNASAYPSNITGGRGAMYGAPVSRLDSSIPNAFTGNVLTPAFSSTTGTSSNGTVVDSQYGLVNSVTFAASPGSSSSNQIQVANIIPNQSVVSDYMVSAIVKSNLTGNFQAAGNISGIPMGFLFGPTTPARLTLLANQPTRLLMWVYNVPINTPVTSFQLWPTDSVGAAVEITRIQALACANGGNVANPGQTSGICAQQRALMIQSGAVNPNRASQSCGTTTTCSASQITPMIVTGTVALSGGTATITGISPAYSSSSSFNVVANDTTTSSNVVKCVPASASSFTCTGTGTDVISYIASGN